MKLARRLQAIKPSATLALNARAKALAASGKDVVVLAAGEPDFDTPEFVKQAAIEAGAQGKALARRRPSTRFARASPSTPPPRACRNCARPSAASWRRTTA